MSRHCRPAPPTHMQANVVRVMPPLSRYAPIHWQHYSGVQSPGARLQQRGGLEMHGDGSDGGGEGGGAHQWDGRGVGGGEPQCGGGGMGEGDPQWRRGPFVSK